MIYIVKYKGEGRITQTILRICTEESECYKQMSNGELHRKRNCEFWPTCKSQKHAELIAYRPVSCNGIKVPRITCRHLNGEWVPRQVGTTTGASSSAKARAAEEHKTDAGRAAQLSNDTAHRDEQLEYKRNYYAEHRADLLERALKYRSERRDECLERSRKWYTEHRAEQLEYHRKYYAEHKK